MQRMPIPLLDPTRNPAPHQGIATAVIERALLDATAAHDRYNVRADAKAFLSGSEMFDHWCKVAGLDPALVGSGPNVPRAGPRLPRSGHTAAGPNRLRARERYPVAELMPARRQVPAHAVLTRNRLWLRGAMVA